MNSRYDEQANDHTAWALFSADLSLNTEWIQKNIDKPWDWDLLSANPSISMDLIRKNIDKPWNWDLLSKNTSISTE